MPTALFISPHLDDVAFSCAGTLMRLAQEGWETCLLTVFTATVPHPQGFALRCQTDKGLAPEEDYMALRRGEDAEFARIVGVGHNTHWPFPEAPHRGYESPADLFAGVHAGDEIWRVIAEELRALAAATAPQIVFAPQGLGRHADHLQVIRAVDEAGLGPRTAWYRDTPYAIREPDARPAAELPARLQECVVGIDGVLERKIAGCCAYASQVGFQFGGVAEVGPKLTTFHQAEARQSSRDCCAERFLLPEGMTFRGLTQ